MSAGLNSLNNIKAKELVVETKSEYPNTSIDAAISDCIQLAMRNDVCAVVRLVDRDKDYIIDGFAIIDQVKGGVK
jgi:hypothetical protein